MRVLLATLGLSVALLSTGQHPVIAVACSVVGAAGAVEISRRLTAPATSPKIRTTVVVIILILILQMVRLGWPPVVAVVLILGTSLLATEVARRITDVTYGWPHPAS